MRSLVTAFTASLAMAASLMAAGPFDGTYAFSKVITVSPTVAEGHDLAPQNNFPLLVRFRATSTATGSDVLAGSLNNGIDIRFTDESGTTPLAFERESWSATAADFWVRVPVMNGTAGGAPVATKIRVYYGNASAEDASNPSAVFDTAANFTVVYHMNGATATDDELDATQNGLHAVAFGAPAPQPGAAGGARRLTTADAVGQDIPHFIVAGSQTNFGVHMRDANNGVAVGIVGLALKTTDGGATWEARKTGARASAANPGNSTKNISLNAVTCAPNNNNICYAVGGGGIVHENHATRYIAKSTDGGETWAKDDSAGSSNTYFGVSCNSSSSCVAVGGTFGGTRYYATLSAEGGAWTQVSASNFGHLNAVSCLVGGNSCIAVGGNSATNAKIVKFVNTDGTWDTVSTGAPAVDNQRLNGVHCLDVNTCIAVGNGGVIQRTTDGGATWTQSTSGTTQNLRSVHCSGDGNACIAVGTALPWTDGNVSAILKSTDGGATWTNKSVAAFGDSLWSVKVTGTNAIIVGANGTVLRSTNAGDTWTLNANSRKLAPAVNGSYDYADGQTGSGKGDNYAVSYWANVNPGTAGAGQQTAFGKGDYHWILQTTNSSAWNVAERNFRNGVSGSYSAAPTGNTTWNNADGSAVTEGWHFVAGTRHNTADAETLFVDGGTKCGGNQTAINSTYETATILTTGRQGYMSAVAIGRATDLYRRQWTRGELDEIRFYSTNRSADWFCLSYQTQNPDTSAYYALVTMSEATNLSRAARNGSNVFQFSGNGLYAFNIPAGAAESAELRIVDVFGRTVWSTSVHMNGQAQTITWNGVAANGSKASAGVYFARLRVVNQGKVTEHALRGSLTH